MKNETKLAITELTYNKRRNLRSAAAI